MREKCKLETFWVKNYLISFFLFIFNFIKTVENIPSFCALQSKYEELFSKTL